MAKEKPVKNKEKTAEEIFDDRVEDAIEAAATLKPSLQTLTFNTELASTMDESKLFELYRNMDNDAIISGALDLFADNVAQENPKTGHVVSVTSADKAFEEEVNDFLHNVVNMDTESWNIVRSLAQYGKVILDTKASNGGADWAFIEVDKPENVLPLTYGQDNIKYFAVKGETKDDGKSKLGTFYGSTSKDHSQSYVIEERDRYIVGFNARKHIGRMKVETESALLNGDIKTHEEELYIRAGKSLLEGAVEAWQTLTTLEDSLFINRLLKSTTFNIVTIDVSDTNNKQAQQMINEVKATFRSSESIDKRADRYSNRQNPIPVDDFIYVPVKGEKGAVSVEQVGGDIGEINLADIDYQRNKLFAGLGVLKAYLGFEETTPGGLGDTTLTMLDERFSRKVKRLRTTLGLITRQMVEYYWVYSSTQRSLDNMPEYAIELGKISTREEEANRKAFVDGINTASSFLGVVNNFEEFVDKEKVFKYIFEEIVGIDVSKIDNKPEGKEIDITVKQLKEMKYPKVDSPATVIRRRYPKHKRKKATTKKEEWQYLKSNYHLLMDLPEVKEIFNEYELYIKENREATPINISKLLESEGARKLLGEKTYKDLKGKTQSQDPKRIEKSKKITGTYIGYDPDEDVIIFEMTAENPEENKKEGRPTAYETQVRLSDLLTYIRERKDGETDLSIVQTAMQGDIKVGCECPASMYWGQQYNGTKEDYSLVTNTIEPTRNKQYQVICKHVASMLTLLPFWSNTIVKDLRQAGTFKANELDADKEELSPEEEGKVLDQIADIESGGTGEAETDTTEPTHKAKPKKADKEETEADKELKDKVADGAEKTKKKPKK